MSAPDLLRCALPAEPDPELAARARRPFLRDAALEALAAARAEPRRATPVLARWFRKARRLGSRDRKVVAEAVYGVIRHEHLLLRAGARAPEELHEGWCRLVEGWRLPELPAASPAEDLATALSLPWPLAREWVDRLGVEEAARLGAALSRRAPVVLRANRARTDRDALAARLAEEGVTTRPFPGLPDALVVEGTVQVEALPAWREGLFEVQDASSQALVEAVAAAADGRPVLDLCAGAGGKSLGLAARGLPVRAFDTREDALGRLRRRAGRAGLSVEVGPPRPAPVVLVDAPCSGTGRLRREPALRWRLELGAHRPLQRALLAQAAELVEPGGLLVYATCSLARADNDHAPPADGPAFEPVEERWLWPHRDGTDGFAWRTWRRVG